MDELRRAPLRRRRPSRPSETPDEPPETPPKKSAQKPSQQPKKKRRFLRKFLLGIGIALCVPVVVVTAVVLNVNSEVERRWIGKIATRLASKNLQGSIEVLDVQHVGLHSIDVGAIAVRDPDGRKVIEVDGAHLHFDAWGLIKGFVDGAAEHVVDGATIERLDVALYDDGTGSPTIGRAFASKDPSPPSPPNPNGLRLVVGDLDVREIHVVGALSGKSIAFGGDVHDGAIALAPEGTRIAVPSLAIDVAPIAGVLRAPLRLRASTDVLIPTLSDPTRPAVDLRSLAVEIETAGSTVQLGATMVAGHLDLHVDGGAGPDAIATLVGGNPPLWAPVHLHADARGTMDVADLDARVDARGGNATVAGQVALGALSLVPTNDRPRLPLATASLKLAALDVRTFVPTAPPLHANADLSLKATSTIEGTEIGFVAKQQPLEAIVDDPFRKPREPGLGETIVAVEGKVLVKKNGDVEGAGALHASLERARLDVEALAAAGKIEARVHLEAPALSQIAALNLPVRGGVTLDLSGGANLHEETFAVSGAFGATEIIEGSTLVPAAAGTLSAQGSFDHPTFALDLVAPHVKSMFHAWPSTQDEEQLHDLRVAVVGTKEAIGVHASVQTVKNQTLVLDTHVVPDPKGMRVVGLDADVRRDRFHGKLHVDEIASRKDVITVKGMRLSSTAGGLRLDAKISPKTHMLDLDVASTELDVDELARAAGIDLGKVDLVATLDGSLHTLPRSKWPEPKTTPADAQGTFAIDDDAPSGAAIARPNAPDVPVLVGSIDVTAKGAVEVNEGGRKKEKRLDGAVSFHIEDRYVKASVRGDLEDVIHAGIFGGATLGGRWDDEKAWRDLVGHVDMHVPNVDLEKAATFLQDLTGRPLGMEVGGKLSFDTHLERSDPKLPPTGDVSLIAEKLHAARGTLVVDPIDGRVRARLERTNDPKKPKDDMTVALFGFLRDGGGPLLQLDAATHAPWSNLVDLVDGGGLSQTTLDLPMHVKLDVPTRPTPKLPMPLRTMVPFDGELSVKLGVDGNIGNPRVALDAAIAKVKADAGSSSTLSVHATYDGKLAHTETTVTDDRRRDAKPQLDAIADVTLVESDLLKSKASGAPAWSAKLDATIDRLPIALFSTLVAEPLGGYVGGEMHVDHLGDPNAKAATMDVKLAVDRLAIGDATFDATKIGATVDEKRASIDVAIDGESGKLRLNGDAPLTWKNASSPAIAPNTPLKATLVSKDFRLRALEPFVTAFDRLDGKLDADVKVDVTPKTVGGKTTLAGGANGTIKLHEGDLIVGAIGEPWKNVDGEIHLSPTKIDVPKLTLHGLTGKADVSASVTLQDLLPKNFHVDLQPDRLPVATQGVPIGSMTGRILVDGSIDPKLVSVKVKVEKLTVDLAPTSDKHPQDLDAEPSIVVLQPIEPPKPVPAPPGSSAPMKIDIDMTNDVWVRRDDLHIAAMGHPIILVDGVPRFMGEVQVDPNMRPWVEQFGKRFYIQKADIRFDGTAEMNPTLDVAVKWTARDATDVTISVGGRLKQPKVTMTADPPATQAEIMSLLVLGRRDAGSASQQEQAQRGAAAQTAALVQGMTGAILGQQLQKMLPAEMTLDFQPGDQGFSDARYAGGYQWNNVYFEVGYDAGAGNASTQPGNATQTSARTTFGIDWRFKPEWSLMTTLGDTGSALVDLLWTFRY